MVQIEICADSGILPNRDCPHRRSEWFIVGQEPQAVCDMHRVVLVDRRSGELATPGTPLQHIANEVMVFLPPEATEWVQDQLRSSSVRFQIATRLEDEGASSPGGVRIVLTDPKPNTTYRIASDTLITTQRIAVAATPLLTEGLEEVRLFADGELLSAPTEAPYSALWQLTEGEHSFQAHAVDRSGQVWKSEIVRISVVD
jgi:penicillin-binding protein 1C